MFFKNLTFFKLEDGFQLPNDFQKELESKIHNSPSPTQRLSVGWNPVFGRGTSALEHTVGHATLIQMMSEERILPASVVRDELQERIAQIESDESRKVGGKEKKNLIEAIEFELLPQAFTKKTYLSAWIDEKNGFIAVDSASASKAESVLDLLRKTLGSLPVFPFDLEDKTLTSLAIENSLQESGFEYGKGSKFTRGENQKAGFTNVALDEVEEWRNGAECVELALSWEDKISFTMNSDFQLKKVKFLDIIEDQMNEHDPQNHREQLDIEFVLMAGEVALLYKAMES